MNNTEYEIKDRSASDVTVQVTANAATVKNAIDTVYRRYSKEAQIPGFRKGRVPRAYLDSRFGVDLFTEEAQKDMEEEQVQQALAELNLRPVTKPEVERVSFDAEGPFVFTASFSVLPDVELPEYRGIEMAVKPLEGVTEGEVNGTLEEIRQRFATLVPKESETIDSGDIVHVKEGDKEWDMRVDAENPVTSQVIGHKTGDTVELDIEQDEGDPLHATLTAMEVKQIVLPEIDDDLAKDAGFDSLDAMKVDINEKIAASKSERRVQRIKGDLLDNIVSQLDLPLPEKMVEEIAAEELMEFKKKLEDPKAPMTFEEYLKEREKSEDELLAEYREDTTQHMRRELVMAKLIEAEGISISDEELEEIATEEAKASGEDQIRFIARLKANEQWDAYHTEKINKRVFDLLYDNAKLSEETE
ncbi:MAG: trigger factor [Candidatus Bipolaricaulota bacterium]|nr:trigger factor [Candidatus Bipolaricaulota bacterium]